MFTVSIQPNAKPTTEVFHNLLRVLPLGLYSGGSTVQAPGRAIGIQPFTAKALEGFTIQTSDQEVVSVPTVPVDTYYWLSLYAKAWQPGDALTENHVEWRLVTDADWQLYGDKPYCIVVAKIFAPAPTIEDPHVRIYPQNIDCTVAHRIDIENRVGQQIFSGSDSFNGMTGKSVTHNLGTVNYRVGITPTQSPLVGLGDIWVTKAANSFSVFCDGTETSNFDWILTASSNALNLRNQGFITAQPAVTTINVSHLTDNSFLWLAPIQLAAEQPFAVADAGHNNWLVQTVSATVTTSWTLVEDTSGLYSIFTDVTIAGGVGSYIHNLGHLNYRAFLLPQFNTSQAVGTLTNNSVDFAGTDGLYRLVIFKRPEFHVNGSATGTTSITVEHGLNLSSYSPLIALTAISAPSIFFITAAKNYFTVTLPLGVTATFDWLIYN